MIPYEETKRGWDKAAATNPNAAIHPAGLNGPAEYETSGAYDASRIVNLLGDLNIDAASIVDGSIIDFGSGNGRVSVSLARMYFRKVYAVDFSYAMLQQIPKSDNIQPVLSVDNWFGLYEPADYAFSISVFIHNTYESGVKMMKSISENLKVGGIALLQIPIYSVAKEPANWTDVGCWTMEQFFSACKESGFDIVEMHTNPGAFSFSKIGPNHHKFQVLKKISQ